MEMAMTFGALIFLIMVSVILWFEGPKLKAFGQGLADSARGWKDDITEKFSSSSSSRKAEIQKLQGKIDKALEEEDYEKADRYAELLDKIRKL